MNKNLLSKDKENLNEKPQQQSNQNKNVLEKLIKLDKKNSSLNLYDKKKK